MLMLKPRVEEKKLVLGDYVTVHVSDVNGHQSRIGHGDVLVQHEDFFQRILKDRRELSTLSNSSKVLHRKAA